SSSNASRGKCSSGDLVSCRHSTSGCAAAMKRRTTSMRSRTELMFQVASVSAMRPSRGSGDGDGEVAEPVDMAFERVALDHGSDAGGRAGIDQIARRQGDEAGEIGDRFGDGPNQLRDVALLADLAVDLEPDRALADMPDLGDRRQRRAGRRLVEALAEIPGPAELLGLALDVAPR